MKDCGRLNLAACSDSGAPHPPCGHLLPEGEGKQTPLQSISLSYRRRTTGARVGLRRRREHGESTRDAMLLVSGSLNRRLGGPSFFDMQAQLSGNHTFTEPAESFNDNVNRRTIYRLWARCGNHPLLESLDCPDPSVMLPRRGQTITPVQSLSLLNNHFVEQCADRLAQRVTGAAGKNRDRQINELYRLTLLRAPTPSEAANRKMEARPGAGRARRKSTRPQGRAWPGRR